MDDGNEARFSELNASTPHPTIFINQNSGMQSFINKSGNGTALDPYIIENYTIDAGGSGTGIEIRNVDLYLIIRNCTIFNSGSGSLDSGIYLYACSNITIINCTIYDNSIGIFLYSGSDDNAIIDNNISNNNGSSSNGIGVRIEDSDYIKVERNRINNNGRYGLYLTGFSDHNELDLNSFAGNGVSQAFSDSSGTDNNWHSSVLGNYWGDYTSIHSGATQDGAVWDTPYLINGTSDVYDEYPLIDFVGVHAPIIIDGNAELDLFFAGNGTNGSSWATAHVLDGFKINAGTSANCIEIRNTDLFLIISNNFLTGANKNWDDAGIKLFNCQNINVSNNNGTKNSIGIYIRNSGNTTVKDNNVYFNEDGLFIDYSDSNNLTGNSAKNNIRYGIVLENSHNNTINESIITNNGNQGINVYSSNDNMIMESNITNNGINGIILIEANSNNISLNNISDNLKNGIHIEAFASNNTFHKNIVERSKYGVLIKDSISNKFFNNSLESCGFGITGDLTTVHTHLIPSSNKVNGKNIYYYANETGLLPVNFSWFPV
ncbi:MAG: NosD domain-containing protein [Candidatus Hodarchaeota archaeon]